MIAQTTAFNRMTPLCLDDGLWLHQRVPDQTQARELLVRRHLAAMLGCAEGTIVFGRGPFGKPLLEAPAASLWFSLARRSGLLLIATSWDGPIGADVEILVADRRNDDVARSFFTAAEVKWLSSLPNTERHPGFFRLWTAKEAVLKARGTGITQGMTDPDLSAHLIWGTPLAWCPIIAEGADDPYTVDWHSTAIDGTDVVAARARSMVPGPDTLDGASIRIP
jgi:4'-phosphopantetheinyl transferase